MNTIDDLYKEWQSLQPLKKGDQERLNQKFMLEFNYNSNHIEGNTLTYGQTELLLLFGRVSGDAKMKDLEEMKAHNVALKMMETEAMIKEKPLTETFIRQMHRTMLREDYTVWRKLPGGEQASYVVHAGQYKTRPNSVITATGERFEYASPEETPALMADLVQWYNTEEQQGKMTPIELAAVFHYRYIRIHPFEDGNGRIARLLVNYILIRHNYPMIVIQSKKKSAYLQALSMADKNSGVVPSNGAHASLEEIRPFAEYMEKVMASELSQNVAFIREKSENVWWYNGEFVTLKNDNTLKLLSLLNKTPNITVRELAEKLPINKSAVQKQLAGLQRNGYITRIGNARTGEWKVVIVCTTKKSGQ